MKKLFGTGIIATLVVVLASSWAYASGNGNTILFPYINSNPGNLSTIINVINTASDKEVCPAGGGHMLHYRYMTKLITASNMDYCDESDFCRPTTKNDIVTFDVAGQIESGKAMFSDDTSYNKGFGAPYFDLPTVMGESCPQRGYLLVSQACGLSCTEPEKAVSNNLDGEAMLLDIVTGAAWGYRAALSGIDAPNYAFAGATSDSNPIPGATTELMAENSGMQKVALYPPDEFCTRFFVTPLVMGYCANDDCTLCAPNTNMADETKMWQKRTGVCLRTGEGKGDTIGVFNRNEAVVSKGQCVQVRCVGAIDLRSLVGSVIDAPDFRSEGGWAYLDLVDPRPMYDPDSDEDICDWMDHPAIVTKLQFGSPSFAGGSMINTADTIRSDRIETGVPGPGAPPSPCE